MLYKKYTTGQLGIKPVFQTNNIQDSCHAFIFIFSRLFFMKSSKFNFLGEGAGGSRDIQNARETLSVQFSTQSSVFIDIINQNSEFKVQIILRIKIIAR